MWRPLGNAAPNCGRVFSNTPGLQGRPNPLSCAAVSYRGRSCDASAGDFSTESQVFSYNTVSLCASLHAAPITSGNARRMQGPMSILHRFLVGLRSIRAWLRVDGAPILSRIRVASGSFRSRLWGGFGVGLGPWVRFGVDLEHLFQDSGPAWGRLGIGVKSAPIHGRFGVDSQLTWGRFGAASGSIWSRSGDELGSIRMRVSLHPRTLLRRVWGPRSAAATTGARRPCPRPRPRRAPRLPGTGMVAAGARDLDSCHGLGWQRRRPEDGKTVPRHARPAKLRRHEQRLHRHRGTRGNPSVARDSRCERLATIGDGGGGAPAG